MNVYNSAAGFSEDDSNMTIMSHSFIYGGNDEPISSCIPIVRRVQQANQLKATDNSTEIDDRNEHISGSQGLLGITRQIEQILNFYRRDLAQESNTQLDCNQQLITRLVDFLRPMYSSDEHQMRSLEGLYHEIFDLQESRCAQQKEKTEQLTNETINLRKLMITPSRDIMERQNFAVLSPQKTMVIDKAEWIEIDEEIQLLYNLVKTQREQIDKLLQLLPPTEATIEENENSLSEVPHATKMERSNDSYEIPITDHVEAPQPPIIGAQSAEHLTCPYCNEILLNHDGIAYIEHLSQCFEEMTGSF